MKEIKEQDVRVLVKMLDELEILVKTKQKALAIEKVNTIRLYFTRMLNNEEMSGELLKKLDNAQKRLIDAMR